MAVQIYQLGKNQSGTFHVTAKKELLTHE